MTQETFLEIQAKFEKLNNRTATRKWIEERFGVKKSRANEMLRQYENISIADRCCDTPSELKVEGDTAFLEKKLTAYDVNTVEDLIKFSGVDLNTWEPVKANAATWKGDSSVKIEFKRKTEPVDGATLLQAFEEQALKLAPKKFVYRRPKENGKLLIINQLDCHIGKGARHSETRWGDYNVEIAKQVYKDAVKQLIESSPVDEIETVLLVVGSDLIHFESEQVTTSSGTRIEGEGTWFSVYNETCKLITEVIESLASQFKVEVMVVLGNHARLTEYALGSYVKAFFRNHENVNVNNEPSCRKYFGWKKSLIAFSHGESVKSSDMPLIMMRENQSTISNYSDFSVLLGHFHQSKLTEFNGVKVFVSPALCPPDNFHSKHGYVGNKQSSQGLLFSDWGLQQIIYSKPPEQIENL